MEKKALNKKTWIIIGVVVALLAVVGVGGFAISRGSTQQRESLLELGQRYLEELNYEQAIVCYKEYLEIDPKCVEAYAGLAQAYVGLEEYEKALEVLTDGYAVTGDGSLLELSSRIETQYNEILMAEINEGDPTEETDAVEEDTEQKEAVFYLIKESQYTNGELVDAREYEYDAFGNVVEEVYYSADGSVSRKYVYKNEYNAEGNLQKTVRYDDRGDILSRKEYKYRENGKKEQVIWYSLNGSMIGEEEYDIDGNLVKDTDYNSDGSIYSTYEYEYDANGNVSSMRSKRYYEDGDIHLYGDNRYEEYDSDGKITSSTIYDEDGDDILSYEEYDSDGNSVRIMTYLRLEDICIVLDTVYEYGDDGYMVGSVTYDEEGKIYEREKWEISEDGIMYYVTVIDEADGFEHTYTSSTEYSNYGMYDTKGYLVWKYVNGVSMPVEREYDENGNVVRITASDRSGNELERYEYEYQQIP